VTTPREGLDQLAAEYAEQRKKLLTAQRKLNRVTATATSARNVLTVTVGPGGQLQEVRFNNRDYRDMGPEDLGEMVKQTVEEARVALAAEVQRAMRPLQGNRSTLDALLGGSFDWKKLFPADMFDQITDAPPTDGRNPR
jgi:DNA-binding protein YbaB